MIDYLLVSDWDVESQGYGKVGAGSKVTKRLPRCSTGLQHEKVTGESIQSINQEGQARGCNWGLTRKPALVNLLIKDPSSEVSPVSEPASARVAE